IGSKGQVTSPGGIVGAFYEAELRALPPGGGKGSLLSKEQGASHSTYLRGDRHELLFDISHADLEGPLAMRRCRALSPFEFASDPALSGPVPSIEAVSYERVGKLGEGCFIVGRVRKHPGRGVELIGAPMVPPLLLLNAEPVALARRFAKRAGIAFACAVALCAASAYS